MTDTDKTYALMEAARAIYALDHLSASQRAWLIQVLKEAK